MNRTEILQTQPISFKNKKNDKDSNNYYSYYNNYLSCQVPPNNNSPPSNEFINRYLTSMLVNKKLDLNLITYKNYK